MRSLQRSLFAGLLFAATLWTAQPQFAAGGDWPRFRGPNGAGVPTEEAPLPATFGDDENLLWKIDLPGPGLSSPIVVGNHVFVTCWSGYADQRGGQGDISKLKRHLVCVDRSNGTIVWNVAIPAVQPEEEFRGMFAENGYASHTPVSDGERVYAFFGKSGVYAFDLAGNELWHKRVGTDDDRRGWGTASSPILHGDLLIVPAFIESQTIFGFNKVTGEEVWKQEAGGFASTWGTPVLVPVDDDRTDLVVGVPYEVWGLNPENGKLRWHCESVDSDSICSSVVAKDGIVYCIEGRSGGAVAIRVGNEGDITKSNVVWSNRERGRIATPVVSGDKVYWVSGGVVRSADLATGEVSQQVRIEKGGAVADANRDNQNQPPGGGRFGSGRSGGGMGGQDYSSPVIGDGKLYYISRGGDIAVFEIAPELKQVGTNRFQGDQSEFSATPAISDGQLFIRSNKALYAVGNK